MKRTHQLLPRAPRQRLRLALLLVLFAALGVQQWAVQSHWHAGDAPGATASVLASAGDTGERNLPGHSDCLWCQSAAHAASAAPPTVWVGFLAPDASFLVRPVAGPYSGVRAPPAWAWQSRGPPAA